MEGESLGQEPAGGLRTRSTRPTSATSRAADRRRVAFVALAGLILSSLVMAGWFHRRFEVPSAHAWHRGELLSDAYDPPTKPVELLLNQGDGQVFAHQAEDPFVRHPEGIRGTRQEQAYRLQRPLYGWLGWVASGGDPQSVAWAMVVMTEGYRCGGDHGYGQRR